MKTLEIGDAARSVQNCTLSGLGLEQAANITKWPEDFGRLGGGPDVIAGQGDVLLAEGRNVGEKAVRNVDASRTAGTEKPGCSLRWGHERIFPESYAKPQSASYQRVAQTNG